MAGGSGTGPKAPLKPTFGVLKYYWYLVPTPQGRKGERQWSASGAPVEPKWGYSGAASPTVRCAWVPTVKNPHLPGRPHSGVPPPCDCPGDPRSPGRGPRGAGRFASGPSGFTVDRAQNPVEAQWSHSGPGWTARGAQGSSVSSSGELSGAQGRARGEKGDYQWALPRPRKSIVGAPPARGGYPGRPVLLRYIVRATPRTA